jgi:hypothetical protein
LHNAQLHQVTVLKHMSLCVSVCVCGTVCFCVLQTHVSH